MSSNPRSAATSRVQRSALAVPATSEGFFEKAARSQADEVFIDLEDAVADGQKERGRSLAIAALNELDWGNKIVSVRVNGLDTGWAYRDIIDVAERCPRLDLIMLPKASSGADVLFVDTLLTGIEISQRRAKRIGLEALIETAEGLVNAVDIAKATRRLEALIFGVGDFIVDMKTSDLTMGSANPDYTVVDGSSGDIALQQASSYLANQWHYAQAKIATVCRAFGLRPIDGPYTDFSNPTGYEAAAHRARALGFEGKWAIHPSQIDAANQAFTPRQELIAWAERVTQAMQQAIESGNGAAKLDGALIDLAHVKLSRNILDRAALIEGARHAQP